MTLSIPTHTQRHLLLVTLIIGLVLWQAGGMLSWGVSLVQLLVVPAWLLQRVIPFQPTSRIVRWMVGATVGPACVAVLYMLAAAVRITLPIAVIISAIWLATAWMCWREWHDCRDIELPHLSWWWVVLTLGIMLIVAWTRVAHIAHVVFPPWVDAVHHALLIRVAYERAQAPWDLTPYLPVTHLTFHSGYHSIMALLMRMSGLTVSDIPRMLLYGGQVCNTLAILSVSAMAWVWWRRWPVVWLALVVAGVISIMPAFYVSWSRYTLLSGMVLLPIALVALEGLWRDAHPTHWFWYMMPLIALSLVHMAVFVMVLTWGIICLMGYGLPRRGVWYAVASAVLITLPWWVFVLGQTRSGAGASAMHVIGNSAQNAFIDALFWARSNRWLVPAFVVVAAWGIWRRTARMAMLVLWVMVVAIVANPWLVRFPYISFFTNETVTTAMYVPMTVGIAWLARWGMDVLGRWTWLIAVGIIVLISVNLDASTQVIRDDTILATADDRTALTWLDANLPPDAVIATNTAGWMWQVDRGSDGGWWALPLTGRMVTTPPVLYTYGDDDWVARVSETTAQLRTMDGSVAQVVSFMQNHPEVTHIYASERGLMKPSVLQHDAMFLGLFTSGDVTIFAVVR